MTEVAVGLIKVVPERWAPEQNLRTLERVIPQMASNGADIVVTPEAFLDGYVIQDEDWTQERFTKVCEPGPNGPRALRLREIAAATGVYLVAGISEVREDGFYNSCYLIGPDGGITGVYSKIQVLPRYRHGTAIPVFDTPFGKLGMMICADRRWPEICRTLALRGAELVLMPTYGMYGTPNDLWMKTRSYENSLWICFAHPRESLVTDPAGTISARLTGDQEYLIHSLDPTITGAPEMLHERHPDVYGFTWETPHQCGARPPVTHESTPSHQP